MGCHFLLQGNFPTQEFNPGLPHSRQMLYQPSLIKVKEESKNLDLCGFLDWLYGVHQDCILSPCLFNLYAEYIRRNAGLDEALAGIKIAGRNINNLRYADDTTLMAESEEELKNLLEIKKDSTKSYLTIAIP